MANTNTRKETAPAGEPTQDAAPTAVEPTQATAPAAAEPARDPAPAEPRPFLSEGTRHDLEQWGRATDPITGAVFVRDPDTGDVTVVEQSGV